MTNRNCSSCLFLHPDPRPDYERHGQCRRYPPVLNMTADVAGDASYHQNWPWMTPLEWCGEYRPCESITADATGAA